MIIKKQNVKFFFFFLCISKTPTYCFEEISTEVGQ